MATIRNYRDVLLQAAAARTVNPPNAALLLVASTPAFHVAAGGGNDPASITFTATLVGLAGTVTFTASGASLTSVTANSAVVTYANMPGATATVTASITVNGTTFSKTVPISKVVDGSVGANGLNNAVIYAYQRAPSVPAGSPGAVDYDFTSKSITTATLSNGWLKTIPAGSNPLYVTAATASSNMSTDSVAAGEWSSPVILVVDGPSGSPGLNNASVFIYQRTNSATAPALPSATATYTFATGGLAGLNNGWSTAFPTSNLAGQFVHVSSATASSTASTDSILAGEWAAPKILAQNGASINNIVPDPTYRDLGFWHRSGCTVSDYTAGSTPWKNGYALVIQETGGALVDTSTEYFAMTPGATYRVEIQVFLSSGFAGSFSSFWHVPGDVWHPMGCPDTGSDWGDALPISFNSSSTKGVLQTFTAAYTVPANGSTFRGQIRFKSQMTAGYIEVGGISIVRMADTNLIPAGVTLNSPTINTPTYESFSVSISGTLSSIVSNGLVTYGNKTANVTGGVAPYTYQWLVEGTEDDNDPGVYFANGSTTNASCSIRGNATNMWIYGSIAVTVTDANGRVATNFNGHIAKHGTYSPP
jgi:hypothetical protein